MLLRKGLLLVWAWDICGGGVDGATTKEPGAGVRISGLSGIWMFEMLMAEGWIGNLEASAWEGQRCVFDFVAREQRSPLRLLLTHVADVEAIQGIGEEIAGVCCM
jgi:hypothetical protein